MFDICKNYFDVKSHQPIAQFETHGIALGETRDWRRNQRPTGNDPAANSRWLSGETSYKRIEKTGSDQRASPLSMFTAARIVGRCYESRYQAISQAPSDPNVACDDGPPGADAA